MNKAKIEIKHPDDVKPQLGGPKRRTQAKKNKEELAAQAQREAKRQSKLAVFDGKTVREVFADVYKKLGGVEGMYKWASRNDFNRATFYKLFGRQLPQQMDSNVDMNASITFIDDLDKAAPSKPEESKS